MGILSDMSSEGSSAVNDENDGGEFEDAARQEAGEAGREPEIEVKTERVALPKPGRRQRAEAATAALEKRLTDLAKSVESERDNYRRELSARDVQLAEMRGRLEGYGQRQSAPVAPQPKAADLRKQARKALDGQDFDEYERLSRDATIAEVEERYGHVLKAPQQQSQRPVPFPVQAVINSYPDVMSDANGLQRVVLEDQRLALDGVADGPARYRQAFEIVRAQLKPANGKPGFSRDSAGVLAGVPTAGRGAGGNGGDGEGVHLTPYEIEVAKRCGMTKEEYAKYLVEGNPKRLQTG